MDGKKYRCPLGWTLMRHGNGTDYPYMPSCIGPDCALWHCQDARNDEVGVCGIASSLRVNKFDRR